MNGMYIGAMGMISSQNHIASRANNIANVSTKGYKFDDMVSKIFEEKPAYLNSPEGRSFIGDFTNKVVDEGVMVAFKQGNLENTNRLLDFSLTDPNIENTSFFVVAKDGDTYLTRNGEFDVNEEGYLRSLSGAYVLDVDNKRISIKNPETLSVNQAGQLVDALTGENIAQLNVKTISKENKHLLQKQESVMFSFDGNLNELPRGNGSVNQAMLESSNVDMSKEMVELLNAQRRFQASQKIFTVFDKVYDKEANQLIR